STRMSARTSVVQARAGAPSTVSQQSWQAPIRQKPARGRPVNSDCRTGSPALTSAVSTVSPARAPSACPSTVMRTSSRSAQAIRVMGRLLADLALAQVLFDQGALALRRVAVAAAPGRLQAHRGAGRQGMARGLVGQLALVGAAVVLDHARASAL